MGNIIFWVRAQQNDQGLLIWAACSIVILRRETKLNVADAACVCIMTQRTEIWVRRSERHVSSDVSERKWRMLLSVRLLLRYRSIFCVDINGMLEWLQTRKTSRSFRSFLSSRFMG